MPDPLRIDPVPVPAAGPAAGPLFPAGGGPVSRAPRTLHMTDNTRKQLESLGWQDGDAVPGDLAQRIAAVRQQYAQEAAGARLQDLPELKGYVPPTPKIVSIDDLPAEGKRELQQYLRDYQQQHAAETARRASQPDLPEDMSPQVRAATRAAEEISAEAERRAMEQPAPATIAVDDRVATGLQDALKPVFCQRCGWEAAKPFEVQISEDDKRAFVAATLSGDRFSRKVSLMGGEIVLVFRTLTSSEVLLINQQVGADQRRGLFVGDMAYVAAIIGYRTVLGLAEVRGARMSRVLVLPPIAEWAKEHPRAKEETLEEYGPTDLPRMQKWLADNVQAESLLRLISQHYRQFASLVEQLEHKAEDPNFWNGIAPPA